MTEVEQNDLNSIIFLSDLHLDSKRVLDKLETIFAGFAALEDPPVAFVMMGNFSSTPVLSEGEIIQKYKGSVYFDDLIGPKTKYWNRWLESIGRAVKKVPHSLPTMLLCFRARTQ